MEEAAGNMACVGLALLDFDQDYSTFPCEETVVSVKDHSRTALTLGTNSSNRLFRQLLATACKSECIFYAKTSFTHRPDDRFDDDAHALSPGECGFVYISGQTSSSGKLPLLITPPSRERGKFDSNIYGGVALVLWTGDDFAREIPIERDGHLSWKGMDLFDPRQPFWRGKAPEVKWPE